MDNKQKLTITLRNENRIVPIKSIPTYNEVLNYTKNLFPQLQNTPFKLGYTDDEDDFVFAKSDMEINEAFRFQSGSNETRLIVITDTDATDQPQSSTPGIKPDIQSNNSTPVSQSPSISLISGSSSISKGLTDSGIKLDDSLFLNALENITRSVEDLKKTKENLIQFNDKNHAKQTESEKLINVEREKFRNLELELQQAKEMYTSTGLELSNIKELSKKLGLQLALKMKEIQNLKKDREDKLRLQSQLEELDKQLNNKIEENRTMNKRLYSLTIERDHFIKKAKELEHELTASQLNNLNLGSLSPRPPAANNNSLPIFPVFNNNNDGGPSMGGSGGLMTGHHLQQPSLVPITPAPQQQPSVIPMVYNYTNPGMNLTPPFKLPVNTNPKTVTTPVVTTPVSPTNTSNTPVYDYDHPPPDIVKEDVEMIVSMGFSAILAKPDDLWKMMRIHPGDITRTIQELLNDK